MATTEATKGNMMTLEDLIHKVPQEYHNLPLRGNDGVEFDGLGMNLTAPKDVDDALTLFVTGNE